MQEQEAQCPAGFWRRLLAFITDSVVVLFISSIIFYLVKPLFYIQLLGFYFRLLISIFYIVFILYNLILITLFGRTLGKEILHIKVVTKQGIKPSFWRTLLREAVLKPLSTFLLNLGNLTMIVDRESRSWHDKISKTRAVLKETAAVSRGDSKKGVLSYITFMIFLIIYNLAVLITVSALYNSDLFTICRGLIDQESVRYSSHYEIITERLDGTPTLDSNDLKNTLEKAYNYSFWIIFPINAKSRFTTVCFYRNPESYNSLLKHIGGSDSMLAAFSPRSKLIYFSPALFSYSPEDQKGVIFHEVNHSLIDNYLVTSNYSYEQSIPKWFGEGVSQLIQSQNKDYTFLGADLKETILLKYKAWDLMKTYEAIDENFSEYHFYAESYLILNFLKETYNENIVRDTLQEATSLNIPIEEAIENITKKAMGELEAEWLIWLSK